jgi:hypothetical protein
MTKGGQPECFSVILLLETKYCCYFVYKMTSIAIFRTVLEKFILHFVIFVYICTIFVL